MSDTPETDGMIEQCQREINVPTNPVPADFARKLERERDEWRQHGHREADMRLQLMGERDDARLKVERERDEIRAQLREEQRLHAQTLDERDKARLAMLSQMAREHLTCGWCGDMMHAPPGFTPPITTEKMKLAVKLHMLDCPKHPIRETERELSEAEERLQHAEILLGDLAGAKENLMSTNNNSHTVGYWTPVTESMPADEITVLVWMGSMEEATLAYHDSEVLERRGDSGWIMAETVTPCRVLLDVTHWCAKIYPPNELAHAREAT